MNHRDFVSVLWHGSVSDVAAMLESETATLQQLNNDHPSMTLTRILESKVLEDVMPAMIAQNPGRAEALLREWLAVARRRDLYKTRVLMLGLTGPSVCRAGMRDLLAEMMVSLVPWEPWTQRWVRTFWDENDATALSTLLYGFAHAVARERADRAPVWRLIRPWGARDPGGIRYETALALFEHWHLFVPGSAGRTSAAMCEWMLEDLARRKPNLSTDEYMDIFEKLRAVGIGTDAVIGDVLALAVTLRNRALVDALLQHVVQWPPTALQFALRRAVELPSVPDRRDFCYRLLTHAPVLCNDLEFLHSVVRYNDMELWDTSRQLSETGLCANYCDFLLDVALWRGHTTLASSILTIRGLPRMVYPETVRSAIARDDDAMTYRLLFDRWTRAPVARKFQDLDLESHWDGVVQLALDRRHHPTMHVLRLAGIPVPREPFRRWAWRRNAGPMILGVIAASIVIPAFLPSPRNSSPVRRV